MTVNVEVNKNANESPVNLVRRFTKRIKGSGILPRMRSSVYYGRQESKFRKKARALKSIARKKEIEHLKKLGKMPTTQGK